jgi:hypothetical protein
MRSTTSFLIVKDEDLGDNMPSHFTSRYGKMNPVTENLNMRTWGELITDKSYMGIFGGTPQINIDGVLCHIVAMKLSPIDNDYSVDGAFKYGIGMVAPFGQLCNEEQAVELLSKYKINID